MAKLTRAATKRYKSKQTNKKTLSHEYFREDLFGIHPP